MYSSIAIDLWLGAYMVAPDCGEGMTPPPLIYPLKYGEFPNKMWNWFFVWHWNGKMSITCLPGKRAWPLPRTIPCNAWGSLLFSLLLLDSTVSGIELPRWFTNTGQIEPACFQVGRHWSEGHTPPPSIADHPYWIIYACWGSRDRRSIEWPRARGLSQISNICYISDFLTLDFRGVTRIRLASLRLAIYALIKLCFGDYEHVACQKVKGRTSCHLHSTICGACLDYVL